MQRTGWRRGFESLKCFSLFSGIGGFDLALTRHGHTMVGACEIDKYARSVFSRHFPRVTIYQDATKIKPEELPDFELLCAGFPCQAFSIAGKRLGFEESRGTLFFEIARIAKQKRPRLLLLENVKGLLSHDRGKTFANILATLDELGYDAQWQVLNSKYFVPQNRERIFIIGYLRETPRPEIFPIRENIEGNNSSRYKTQGKGSRLQNQLSGSIQTSPNKGTATLIAGAIDANYYKGYGTRTMLSIPVLTPDRLKKRQNGRRFKEDGDPSFTLTSQDRHGIFDGKNIRRLTPIECERLQGFPDNYTAELSDTQRYKCLGNAVTVPVIEFILEKFKTEKLEVFS